MQINPITSPIACAYPHYGGRCRVAADRSRPGGTPPGPRCGAFSIRGTDAALIERGAVAYADTRFAQCDVRRFLTGLSNGATRNRPPLPHNGEDQSLFRLVLEAVHGFLRIRSGVLVAFMSVLPSASSRWSPIASPATS